MIDHAAEDVMVILRFLADQTESLAVLSILHPEDKEAQEFALESYSMAQSTYIGFASIW